jgi:hypothetical protein
MNNVSHAFLLGYWAVKEPKLGVFEKINSDYVRALVASGGGAAGGAAAGPAGGFPSGSGSDASGIAANPRDTWTPLTGVALAGGMGDMPGGFRGGPGGPPGGFPGGSKFAGGRFRGGVPGGGGADAGGGPAGEAPKQLKGKPRYEFVAVFIWREPTPSDALMKTGDAGAATAPK